MSEHTAATEPDELAELEQSITDFVAKLRDERQKATGSPRCPGA